MDEEKKEIPTGNTETIEEFLARIAVKNGNHIKQDNIKGVDE